MRLAQWLDSLGVLWNHATNEGRRSWAQGKRLRAQGMKKGFPDVLVFLPRGGGIAVELKSRRPGAKASPEQVEWLRRLSECGWHTGVCYGADEAIEFIGRFL